MKTSDSNKNPTLIDKVKETIGVKHYSRETQKAYLFWIKRYIGHNQLKHPRDMGAEEVEIFLIGRKVDVNHVEG